MRLTLVVTTTWIEETMKRGGTTWPNGRGPCRLRARNLFETKAGRVGQPALGQSGPIPGVSSQLPVPSSQLKNWLLLRTENWELRTPKYEQAPGVKGRSIRASCFRTVECRETEARQKEPAPDRDAPRR